MLILDWFGCLLTGCGLAALLPGRHRVTRAVAAMALGELGRALLVFIGGGTLRSVTVGGAFTQMQVDGFPASVVRLGGLYLAALAGLLVGPVIGRDLLLYALYASLAALLLPAGWPA